MPISPPAPPRLSTTNCWPRYSESLFENWRAVMSLPPPGANGTTTRTGLAGYCCASAGHATSVNNDTATAFPANCDFMGLLVFNYVRLFLVLSIAQRLSRYAVSAYCCPTRNVAEFVVGQQRSAKRSSPSMSRRCHVICGEGIARSGRRTCHG